MGSRSGKKTYVYESGVRGESYTEERNGVKIVRIRWHFEKQKKRTNKSSTKK